MKKINVLLMLLLIGIFIIVGMGIDEYTVVFISIGIVLVAFTTLKGNSTYSLVALSISLILGYFYPILLFFAVLIGVQFINPDSTITCTYAFTPLIVILISGELLYLYNLILFTLISLIIWSMYCKYDTLRKKHENYHDETRESQKKLLATNKYLTEGQNHGIKIALLEERNRIARDIHDGVGHLISRTILQLGASIVTEKDDDKKAALIGIKDSLNKSMDEIRKSVHNIVEEDTDLELLLHKVVDEFKYCDLTYTYDLSYRGDMNFNYSIMFIIQESLNNIMVHSNATHAEISLRDMGENIYLLIKDNGTNSKIEKLGLGLASIRERINAMGGNIEISTDKGFRIFITLRKEKL